LIARSVFSRAASHGAVGALALGLFAAPPGLAQAPPGSAFINLGFVGFADAGWSSEPDVGSLLLGDHDPRVRGFTIPNVELTLNGSVDPFFQGFANIAFKVDDEGETGVELEEAFFLTTALPGNLQVKGGQFFVEFGRQNLQHPHAWAFVDQPLVLGTLLGPEGLRGQGARISWLAPTSVYTEAMVTVLNSAGETVFSFQSGESSEIHGGEPQPRTIENASDLLFVPRLTTSLDLTETQTVVVGASAAVGPNSSGPDASTRILGADLYWRWRSASQFQGFPFLSFQTEWLVRRYEAAGRTSLDDPLVALPAETLQDWGTYAELLWGFQPRWVVGARGELVRSGAAAFVAELRTDRFRLSPNLTWYPSEYSKVRVQYNLDHRDGIGYDHSLWAQLEFIMGAHAAHRF
jgi:hypothetical protein